MQYFLLDKKKYRGKHFSFIDRITLRTKVFLLFSLLFIATVNQFANAQKVTISLSNAKLEQVFSEISKQTSYNFLCSDEIMKGYKPQNVNMKDLDLNEALKHLLKKENLDYKLMDKTILINKTKTVETKEEKQPKVQQIRIRGKILDETNQPMVGVIVSVKGGTLRTATDKDGNYSIDVPDNNAVLIFSFIGYQKKEIPVSGKTVINVSLESESAGLDEVIVVGYGTQKKETLTGSVASIKASEITTTKSESLINNIQGKVPGLLIRQQTGEPGVFDNLVSIRGYGAPLVVIDGVTRDGTAELAQLNPDDVESISVLKDASAAIYGMNAANGVIIVTTKKGQDGNAKVSYSNLVGIKGATGMEFTVDAYKYRQMANEMQRNIGAAPTYSNEILEKYRNNEPGYTDHNWVDMFLHDWVLQHQQNVSIRGGSEKIKYFNSFGYTKDNGLLKGGDQFYRRLNMRSTTTANLSKDLTLNFSVSGIVDNTQAPRDDFQWIYKNLMISDRGINYHTIANPDHLSVINPENKNAYALVNSDIDGYRTSRNFQYQSTAELTYKAPFAPGLSLVVLGAFDGRTVNNSKLHKTYKLYDYYTDEYSITNGAGTYTSTLKLSNRAHARGQVNYTRSFAEKHSLNLTAVAEMTATRLDELEGARRYTDLYTSDILDLGTSTTSSNNGRRTLGRLAAYLGRVNYDYAGKYLFEAVGRYDGSHRYARGKRWVFFPSMSAAWRISEESFLKDKISSLNNLKLRLSYGKSGRDAGDAFAYVKAYTLNPNRGYVFSDGALTNGITSPGVVTDKLSWIESTTTNLGIDFDFWKGKLGGSIDAFERKNTGLLANRFQSVSNIFGASFPQENLNSDLNRGFEFALTHRSKIGSDFNYSVSANFTYSRRKQLHFETAEFANSWDRWKTSNENRYDGRMWLYEYKGQYTSLEQYQYAPLMGGSQGNSKMLPGSYAITDINGDGVIDSRDQTPNHWNFGAINPPMQYGLTLAASYKSFDFNALFQGAAGYSINYRNDDIWGYGRYPTLHEKFLDRWHTANITDDPYNPATQWISGYYPALRSNTANTTDQYVIDVWRPNAAYVRLKSVELGYTLPKKMLSKIGVSNLRVFANGFNLLTFCSRELKNADPERQERDWSANAAYPLMKSYNIGLNLNF